MPSTPWFSRQASSFRRYLFQDISLVEGEPQGSNHSSLYCIPWQEDDASPDPEGQKNLEELNKFNQLDFMPFDPRQKRTEGKLQGPDGAIFRISKVQHPQKNPPN